MALSIKPGVNLLGLKAPIIRALADAVEFLETQEITCVVTSGTDGKHMVGSLHSRGLAIDIRSSNIPSTKLHLFVSHIRTLLGPLYDVILESDHIHIEYDPK